MPAGLPSIIRMDFRRRKTLLRVGLVLVVLVLLLAGRLLAGAIVSLSTRIQTLGVLAPVAFILLYAVGEVVFVPGSLLTLAAGALFGLGWGTAVAMVGATLGAVAAFLVARHVLRGLVERRVQAWPRFRALDAALAREGRKIVFLVRLTPLIPFNALNYALGITRVRFVDYLIGSIGMLPGALLYAYYGQVVGDVARVASGAVPPRGAEYYLLLGGGLLATLALTIVLTRTARRALASSSGSTTP